MSFEKDLIKQIVGEEVYYELCCELGGLRVDFKKGDRDTVAFLYNKGLKTKQIAHKMGVTERFVYSVLKKNKEQIGLF